MRKKNPSRNESRRIFRIITKLYYYYYYYLLKSKFVMYDILIVGLLSCNVFV